MQILRLAALVQLQALSFEELFRLASRAEETCVPAGRRLLLAGGLHEGLTLIAAGSGVVRCAGEAIGKLGPGDVFGALSMRHSIYATATLHVVEDLQLLVFGNHAVQSLRVSAPEAVDALLAACSDDCDERAAACAGSRPQPRLRPVSAAA